MSILDDNRKLNQHDTGGDSLKCVLIHHPNCRSGQHESCCCLRIGMIPDALENRRECFSLFDEVRKFVENDDCVLFGKILKEWFPIVSNPRDASIHLSGITDEGRSLLFGCPPRGLIVYSVVAVADRLKCECCLSHPPPIHHGQCCSVTLIECIKPFKFAVLVYKSGRCSVCVLLLNRLR